MLLILIMVSLVASQSTWSSQSCSQINVDHTREEVWYPLSSSGVNMTTLDIRMYSEPGDSFCMRSFFDSELYWFGLKFIDHGISYAIEDSYVCADLRLPQITESECRCPAGSGSSLSQISSCPIGSLCVVQEKQGPAEGCAFRNAIGNYYYQAVVNYEARNVWFLRDPVQFVDLEVCFYEPGVDVPLNCTQKVVFGNDIDFVATAPNGVTARINFNLPYLYAPKFKLATVNNGEVFVFEEGMVNGAEEFDLDYPCGVKIRDGVLHYDKRELSENIFASITPEICKEIKDKGDTRREQKFSIRDVSPSIAQYETSNRKAQNFFDYENLVANEALVVGYNDFPTVDIVIEWYDNFNFIQDIREEIQPVMQVAKCDYTEGDDNADCHLCATNQVNTHGGATFYINTPGLRSYSSHFVFNGIGTRCINSTIPFSTVLSSQMTNGTACIQGVAGSGMTESCTSVLFTKHVSDEVIDPNSENSQSEESGGEATMLPWTKNEEGKISWQLIVFITCMVVLGCIIIIIAIIIVCNLKTIKIWRLSKKIAMKKITTADKDTTLKNLERELKNLEQKEFLKRMGPDSESVPMVDISGFT